MPKHANACQKELFKQLESSTSIEVFFNNFIAMMHTVCNGAGVACPEGFAALETAKRAFAQFDE